MSEETVERYYRLVEDYLRKLGRWEETVRRLPPNAIRAIVKRILDRLQYWGVDPQEVDWMRVAEYIAEYGSDAVDALAAAGVIPPSREEAERLIGEIESYIRGELFRGLPRSMVRRVVERLAREYGLPVGEEARRRAEALEETLRRLEEERRRLEERIRELERLAQPPERVIEEEYDRVMALLDRLYRERRLTGEEYDRLVERAASIVRDYRQGIISPREALDLLQRMERELYERLRAPPRPAKPAQPPRVERPPAAPAAPAAPAGLEELSRRISQMVRETMRSVAAEMLAALTQMLQQAQQAAGAERPPLVPQARGMGTAPLVVGYRFQGYEFPSEVWLEWRATYNPYTKRDELIARFDPDTEWTLKSIMPIHDLYFELGCYIWGCPNLGWPPASVYLTDEVEKGLIPREWRDWVLWISRIIDWLNNNRDAVVEELKRTGRLVWRHPSVVPVGWERA